MCLPGHIPEPLALSRGRSLGFVLVGLRENPYLSTAGGQPSNSQPVNCSGTTKAQPEIRCPGRMALYLGMSTIVVDNAPDKVALSTTTAPTGSQARFNRDNEFHFEHKQVNRYAVILHTPPPFPASLAGICYRICKVSSLFPVSAFPVAGAQLSPRV